MLSPATTTSCCRPHMCHPLLLSPPLVPSRALTTTTSCNPLLVLPLPSLLTAARNKPRCIVGRKQDYQEEDPRAC